jgi:hypothetical protein
MATDTKNELESFQQFLHRHLSDSGDKLSPEECLQLWRAEHPTSRKFEESVAAVQRALQQAEVGEGVSLEEFDREFRKKHNLSARP